MRPASTCSLCVFLLLLLAGSSCSSDGNKVTDTAQDSLSDQTDPDTEPGDLDVSDASDMGDVNAPDGDALLDVPVHDVFDADVLAPAIEDIYDNHSALLEQLVSYLDAPAQFVGGEWQFHYGDAPMYGPAFDLRYWQITGETSYRDRAIAALETDLVLVQAASVNLSMAIDDMETMAMSLLGVLEAARYLDDPRYHDAGLALIQNLDNFTMLLNDYLDIDAGMFAANTYGPTSISTFLALMHLQYAIAFPDDAASHLVRAEEILDNIHDAAWDDAMGAYRFAPDNTDLYLYPNVMMMLASARAYQLTENPLHLERIRAAYAGIQPLKAASADHYHSPYSAEYMGATDEDYATLSSQNYTMLALYLGARATGDTSMLSEVDTILGWLETHLLEQDRLLHHWMNGRIAIPADPEFHCNGCNLQTLYVLTMLITAP